MQSCPEHTEIKLCKTFRQQFERFCNGSCMIIRNADSVEDSETEKKSENQTKAVPLALVRSDTTEKK